MHAIDCIAIHSADDDHPDHQKVGDAFRYSVSSMVLYQ
jgi:hypothetical protein